jgi:hypothetical protein
MRGQFKEAEMYMTSDMRIYHLAIIKEINILKAVH